jgi:NAD+ kinase
MIAETLSLSQDSGGGYADGVDAETSASSGQVMRENGDTRHPARLRRVGLVVHPTRDVGEALREIEAWAKEMEVEVGQVPFANEERQVAEEIPPHQCDVLLAIGGDGTTLSAIRSSAAAGVPVLGVACGSLGVLTVVAAREVGRALGRFATGDWIARHLPALVLKPDGADHVLAFNDIVAVREGEGQARISARVDNVLFARFAGDGCIVSTPVGSSAYTIAAGGPLLPPSLDAFCLTPLPAHGGFRPPLVIQSDAELELEVDPGYGGARLEVDGQRHDLPAHLLQIHLRPSAATVVGFDDQVPFLSQLRERGVITDSPRILAEDSRRERQTGHGVG